MRNVYRLYAYGYDFTRKEVFNTEERAKIALEELGDLDEINSADVRDNHGELIYTGTRTSDGWTVRDQHEKLQVATADIEIEKAHKRGEI